MEIVQAWKRLGRRVFQLVRRRPYLNLFIALTLVGGIDLATLPFGNVRELANVNPTETAFMKYQEEQAKDLQKPFRKKFRWIALRQIPKDAISAVIVAEDGTFWSHEGFDWYEFKESFSRNVREGRLARGASTITQQMVKNLYLSPSKNPWRKVKEWILTWHMEQTLSKARILELYLNVIEWGDGVYGIEAAAEYYFGKSASALSRQEGARLAAIIPSPRRHKANSDSKYVVRRSNLILNRMEARGW